MPTSTLTLTDLITTDSPRYIDVDMNLTINAITGDVGLKTDLDAIVQNVKNAVLLEKLWDESNTDIQNMLFESLNSPFFQYSMNEKLESAIKARDKRIADIYGELTTYPDDNMARLDIYFSLITDPGKYYSTPVWQKIR